MTNKALIQQYLSEHLEVIQGVQGFHVGAILSMGTILSNSLSQGGTIFWCGNGGSAADSQHLAAELVGRFKNDRRALRSLALTTDSSVLTCIANDYSYEDIFSRQVQALGSPGDVLVVISTSGNSENILRVLRTATDGGLTTLALLGKDGGAAKSLVEHSIIVPSASTARIQEAHILIGHILCDFIERNLGLA